jgi:hypothetical protein
VMSIVMGSGLPNIGFTLSISSVALIGQYEQKTMEKHILSHETNDFEFPPLKLSGTLLQKEGKLI